MEENVVAMPAARALAHLFSHHIFSTTRSLFHIFITNLPSSDLVAVRKLFH